MRFQTPTRTLCVLLFGAVVPTTTAPAVSLDLASIQVDIAPREAAAPASDPAFRIFAASDGLIHSRIYTLAQDSAGYVWAGTEVGLARYDARHWESIELPGTKDAPPPYVNALVATGDGALWVATDELGVFRHMDGHFAAPGGDVLPSRYVQALAPARDVEQMGNAVWVGTGDGVAHCTASGCRLVPATRGLAVYTLLEMRDASERVLWVGTIEHGLHRFVVGADATDARGTLHLRRDNGLPADSIRALAAFGGADGNDLWIGTGFGFARLAGPKLTVYDTRAGLETAAAVAFQPSRDANGAPLLHVALQRGGLATVRDDGTWSRTGLREGLPDDHVNALLVTDTERRVPRLWLGTKSSGVVRRDGGRFAAITPTNGLPGRNVMGVGRAAFPDGIDAPWVGTVGGSVRRVGGQWVPFGPAPLDRAEVYEVTRADDGSLWVAASAGLVHWRSDGVTVFDRHALGTAGNSVLAARPRREADGRTAVWFGTRSGGARLIDGKAEPFPDEAPRWLATRVVRAFVEVPVWSGPASSGPELWVGGEEGIAILGADGWRQVPATCFRHREVFDLRLAPDTARAPELYAATRAGLTRIATVPTLRCDSVGAERLAGAVQYQVQLDRAGRIYLFGYQGVTRLTPDPAAPHALERARIERFGERDGLPALEFNRSSFVDVDGRLWGGTVGGVAVLDPASEPLPQAAKPLRVVAERVDPLGATPLVPGSALSADRATVRFDFALLSYEREHSTRYRTQLVGLDPRAGDWTAQPHVRYDRVPPGEYTFRVWGRDAFGTETGPVDVPFRVGAPRWQDPWALVAYAALLLLIGNGIGRWRQRALAARAAELEREVAQRTHDLELANAQLQQASLTDPLTGLNNRRYFAATLAHELDGMRGKAAHALLALIDLDHFKSINDRFGHAVGDAVLKQVAEVLAPLAAPRGAALRWGGEEFLLVLPLAPDDLPSARAERVLDAVRACRVEADGRALAITASLGWLVWPWTGPERVALSHMLTVADQALYRAKHEGRDRAIGVEPDPTAAPLDEAPHLRLGLVRGKEQELIGHGSHG